MKINELHTPSTRFLRSTQLERDFSDPGALEGYILTPEIELCVGRLARGLAPNSGQRAWRITGDYGSGKSSFALLFANLIARENSTLPKHIRHLQREFFPSSARQKLLPVLVTGSREPIALVLLRALNNVLKTEIDGRLSLQSHVNIQAALRNVERLNDEKVVELVDAAAKELHARNLYRGIFIVLDELGKFLEFASLNPERQDVFFLQRLGEVSARSGDSCLFTVSLLHQGFGAYADTLSEAAQREWEKIAGRFEELVFAQPLAQTATLVAAALELKDVPDLRGWKTKAQSDMGRAVDLGLFGAEAHKTGLLNIAAELYPLHATVLPVLAKFFRRFGQNERSLFSFLLSSEPYALQSFAMQEVSPDTVYRLHDFYDFGAQSFGHRLSTQSFRSHWNHIDGVIRSYPSEQTDELRVLKTVGILNTVESPELVPTAEVLAVALDDIPNLQVLLKGLVTRGILYFRGRSGGYALWPHGSINLEQAFARATETIHSVQSIAELIRERLETRPLVATRHYIETGTLRFFDIVYTTISALEANRKILKPEFPADGRLVVILSETKEQQLRAKDLAQTVEELDATYLGITSPLDILTGLILELERWTWVEQNTPELKDDRFAAEEVSRQLAVTTQTLEKAIARHIGIRGVGQESSSTIRWYYNGEEDPHVNSKSTLQAALSEICRGLFRESPHIHNELVNRHDISSAAASARQKLFGLMLKNRREPNLGLALDKAPPEKSMYLSVLHSTGIHRAIDGQWDIGIPAARTATKSNVRPALMHIISMLERKPEEKVLVAAIIAELRQPPFGVRDGLSPLLLATVLIEHESEIAVYEDGRFVPDVEEFLLMRLTKRPDTFAFQLTRITGVRRQLIERFADVLTSKKADKVELVSIVRPLCGAVAGLPEFAQTTERISERARALRAAVLSSVDPSQLVFGSIPRALGFDVNDESLDAGKVAKTLSETLTELRRAFPELQARMASSLLSAFGSEQELSTWRPSMAARAEAVLLAVTDPDLRTFSLKLKDALSAEHDWLESLGSFLVRRPPSRWRDQDEIGYVQHVTELAQRYLRLEATHFGRNASYAQEAIRVALTRATGEEVERVLSLSAKQIAEAAKHESALEAELPKDPTLALAVLSQLMWKILRSKS
jgi:hypothetical protein